MKKKHSSMLIARQLQRRCLSSADAKVTPPKKDRRPIFARSWSLSQSAANALASRNVHANSISLASLGFGAASLACFAGTGHVGDELTRALWFAGGSFIQCRLVANMLDGMVATSPKSTPTSVDSSVSWTKDKSLGGLFNEVPDRLTDSLTLIGLGLACGNLSLGLAASGAAIATAYVRAMGAMYGTRQYFNGVMSKPRRMFFVTGVAAACALVPEHAMLMAEGSLFVILLGSLLTCYERLRLIAAELRQQELDKSKENESSK
jgi:phosphatidylglycerophosphate synthase